KRWEDVGEVGVEIQWESEEYRATEEALIETEGANIRVDGTRRFSTTVVEFDAGP
ncbi:hypothetical protein BGX21_004170, partial [Mortierella sp. AD011]